LLTAAPSGGAGWRLDMTRVAQLMVVLDLPVMNTTLPTATTSRHD
jgi:hypothetical protein